MYLLVNTAEQVANGAGRCVVFRRVLLDQRRAEPRAGTTGADFEGHTPWSTAGTTSALRLHLPRGRLFPLVGLLDVAAGFVFGALGVVVGLQGLAVFVDGALALSGDVEDFAQLDVAPDLGPAGIAIAVQAFAVGVGGGLVVALQEEDLDHAIVRQARKRLV